MSNIIEKKLNIHTHILPRFGLIERSLNISKCKYNSKEIALHLRNMFYRSILKVKGYFLYFYSKI